MLTHAEQVLQCGMEEEEACAPRICSLQIVGQCSSEDAREREGRESREAADDCEREEAERGEGAVGGSAHVGGAGGVSRSHVGGGGSRVCGRWGLGAGLSGVIECVRCFFRADIDAGDAAFDGMCALYIHIHTYISISLSLSLSLYICIYKFSMYVYVWLCVCVYV